ncbi:Kelch-like protein 10 [Zootermopsis nevadensis]|uniref:Kelch-like protein 10 n=1 Tax=Zootermopsis nevadensis TaxID=136037 RepID=A0A067RHD6_ZOONE|nr:Kelch-like protein 10 [Zootermopsis nevadensis]
MPDISLSRGYSEAVVIDDMIFVIGKCFEVVNSFSFGCFDDVKNEWYQATESNVYRFGMSICVVKNLPNAKDYAYKHRDKLKEGKRTKLLALRISVEASL